MRTAAATAAAVALAAWLAWQMRLQPLVLPSVPPPLPVVDLSVPAVRLPGQSLVADLPPLDDEFLAYLLFDHLRGLVARDGFRTWLTFQRHGKRLVYVIRLGPGSDLLAATPYVLRLNAATRIDAFCCRWVNAGAIARYDYESSVFDQAYRLPARRKLELLPRAELTAYLRRFIRYKAVTDACLSREGASAPVPPDAPAASRLAEDIVAVADFYTLPLDFFLGIGAMENNYMNVAGDIGHAVWKSRAEKGDVVLKRGRRGVLVLNEASGVWQITRETLRYAHRLFLKDARDYSALPEHLRPPSRLDLNNVPSEVLTTYAGLFFRDLLDRFHGDVAQAVGAYNGGPRNPNPQYEAGVRLIAQHARRMLEHAAALEGRPAAGMRFLRSAR